MSDVEEHEFSLIQDLRDELGARTQGWKSPQQHHFLSSRLEAGMSQSPRPVLYCYTCGDVQVSSSVHAGQGLNLMIWTLSHSHPFMKGSNARGHTQGWLMLCEWEIIYPFNADTSYVDGIFYRTSHTCKHRACASSSRCIYSGDVSSKILHSFSFLQMPQMWGQGCLSPKKGWRCVTRVWMQVYLHILACRYSTIDQVRSAVCQGLLRWTRMCHFISLHTWRTGNLKPAPQIRADSMTHGVNKTRLVQINEQLISEVFNRLNLWFQRL